MCSQFPLWKGLSGPPPWPEQQATHAHAWRELLKSTPLECKPRDYMTGKTGQALSMGGTCLQRWPLKGRYCLTFPWGQANLASLACWYILKTMIPLGVKAYGTNLVHMYVAEAV